MYVWGGLSYVWGCVSLWCFSLVECTQAISLNVWVCCCGRVVVGDVRLRRGNGVGCVLGRWKKEHLTPLIEPCLVKARLDCKTRLTAVTLFTLCRWEIDRRLHRKCWRENRFPPLQRKLNVLATQMGTVKWLPLFFWLLLSSVMEDYGEPVALRVCYPFVDISEVSCDIIWSLHSEISPLEWSTQVFHTISVSFIKSYLIDLVLMSSTFEACMFTYRVISSCCYTSSLPDSTQLAGGHLFTLLQCLLHWLHYTALDFTCPFPYCHTHFVLCPLVCNITKNAQHFQSTVVVSAFRVLSSCFHEVIGIVKITRLSQLIQLSKSVRMSDSERACVAALGGWFIYWSSVLADRSYPVELANAASHQASEWRSDSGILSSACQETLVRCGRFSFQPQEHRATFIRSQG